jgi:hypothetical protein
VDTEIGKWMPWLLAADEARLHFQFSSYALNICWQVFVYISRLNSYVLTTAGKKFLMTSWTAMKLRE